MPGLNCGIGCSAAQPVCNASITGCADFYACQFPAMIADWRDKFNGHGAPIPGVTGKASMRPFLFVELAPYTEGVGEPGDTSVAVLREAQYAALGLPAVAVAAAYDFGDTKSPLGNIHPRWKGPVGKRLSLAAQGLVGGAGTRPFNPVCIAAIEKGPSVVELHFDRAVVVLPPLTGPCPVANTSCAWVSIGGRNATLGAAAGSVVSATITAPGEHNARSRLAGEEVHYLFGDWPVPTIYDAAAPPAGIKSPPDWSHPGFPARPFRIAISAAL